MKFVVQGVQKLEPEQIDKHIDRQTDKQTRMKTLPSRYQSWQLKHLAQGR